MSSKPAILEWSDEKVLETARALHVAYKLKRTLRYASARDQSVHSESVAEHVFALLFLAEYFLPLEDPDGKLDGAKVRRMALFHDFGEIPNGDIPYHRKTAEHERQEREDAEAVFASLPDGLREIARETWLEYEDRKSPEALFAQALDKIEPSFELLDPVSHPTLKRIRFTYEAHMGRKLAATERFPVMRRFVEVIGNHLRDLDVFWKE